MVIATGGFMDASQFAVVVTPLETAQALAERPGAPTIGCSRVRRRRHRAGSRRDRAMMGAHFAGTGLSIKLPPTTRPYRRL